LGPLGSLTSKSCNKVTRSGTMMATSAAAPGVSSQPSPSPAAGLYGSIAVLGVALAAVLAQVNAHVPEPYMVSADRSTSHV
jgi:hypothetical protein